MHKLLKTKLPLLLLLLLIALSCIDDDVSKCPSGLSVGFTYNLYNQDMEYADGFNNVVNDITLLVFDEAGNYIEQHSAVDDDLRMNGNRIDVCCLPSGSYQLVAWGGIHSNSFVTSDLIKGSSTLADVLVSLNKIDGEASDEDLVPLFYGRATVDNYRSNKITKVEVPLIKNTNTFRILLQNANNEEINPDAFKFEIIDTNYALNSDNERASDVEVYYVSAYQGKLDLRGNEVYKSSTSPVAFAEISTSKLFASHTNSARLRIYNNVLEKEVLNLPLIQLVLMMKNEKFSQTISNQTYLDRIHSYNMTFFLLNDNWMKTHIVVNDWTVRLNNIEDL